jgi:hypothetical protein
VKDSLMEEASIIQQQYKDGLAYKVQQGYPSKWAEFERFRAGDQWAPPTNRTKSLPRPTLNLIDQIQSHRVSSVMNENIKMVFSASEVEEESPIMQAADTFTRFADSTWERIGQDDLNEEALDSASNIGTAIWHYYWDSSKQGGNKLKWSGQLEGETIDAVNFFPSNPQQRFVQKQKYIIITNREDVSALKSLAKANGLSNELVNLIQPDSDTQDQVYDKAKQELTGSDKVTVITKYWKEDVTEEKMDERGIPYRITYSQIFFTKVAGNVVVKPKTNTRLKLYPLEVMQWKRRKRSIFGVGDTEGLIPNQKSINFLIAMQILSVQNTGFPKLLVKKEFIMQNPTNDPGEIVYDNSPPGSGWGMQYLNPGNISGHAQNLVDTLTSFTKEVSGANESSMGEQVSANMPASAIMMLQKAAGIPIESVKRRFYKSMENIGRIWEEFFKVYYNTTRMITVKDDDQETYSTEFNGSEHQDTEMNLKIDVGASSAYSETLMMSSLDKLFDKGDVNLEQYLKYAPKNVVPFKDRLLKEIQKIQEQQMNDQGNADQLIQQLPPEEQQAFMSAPPELQQQMLSQIQAPQGQPPM